MDTHLSTKGQVIIPVELRRKYKLEPGMRLRVVDTGEGILLTPVTEQDVAKLRGILKGSDALKILLEERARDAERENRS
jgi:AbrB family looped-hinge helix DNA binding protein